MIKKTNKQNGTKNVNKNKQNKLVDLNSVELNNYKTQMLISDANNNENGFVLFG